MKRFHIITNPTGLDSLADIDEASYASAWQLKNERLEAKRLRKFRQQMA